MANLARERSNLPVRRSDDVFTRLQEEMNRLFQDFNAGGFDIMPFSSQGAMVWAPRVDVTENDKDICVSAELPGVEEKDIDVSVENDVLRIRGEKKEEKTEQDKNYHRVERHYGSFERAIALPTEIDAGKVEATFKKGVLHIVLPKSQKAQQNVRKVPVKPG